jgi:hypothetical protein
MNSEVRSPKEARTPKAEEANLRAWSVVLWTEAAEISCA